MYLTYLIFIHTMTELERIIKVIIENKEAKTKKVRNFYIILGIILSLLGMTSLYCFWTLKEPILLFISAAVILAVGCLWIMGFLGLDERILDDKIRTFQTTLSMDLVSMLRDKILIERIQEIRNDPPEKEKDFARSLLECIRLEENKIIATKMLMDRDIYGEEFNNQQPSSNKLGQNYDDLD